LLDIVISLNEEFEALNTKIIIPPLNIFSAPYQEFLSPYEAALRLGIAQKTIWDWARDKTIQCRKTESEGQYEIESSPLGISDTYLLEFKDINKLFFLPEITIKQWLKKKGLRGIKTGKLWRFAPADLFKFFSENTNLLDSFFNHPDRRDLPVDDEDDEFRVYEHEIGEFDWEKIISERKHWMKYGNIEKPRKNSKSPENESGKVTPFSPIYRGRRRRKMPTSCIFHG